PEAKPVSADDTAQPGGKVGHRRTQHSETPPEKSGGVSIFPIDGQQPSLRAEAEQVTLNAPAVCSCPIRRKAIPLSFN
ncbi:hypothetical protein, partial [Mycolicibacter algericus]|uniref:hypothetical protein n=1 Tax=Mycolicibacter algericus TaxID=1288388 RepID=UPI001A98BE5E